MDSTLLLISSSKSYDYAVGNKFGATVRDKNTYYNAALVCNIAPDRKYDAYTSCTFLHTWLHFMGILGKGELNYSYMMSLLSLSMKPSAHVT